MIETIPNETEEEQSNHALSVAIASAAAAEATVAAAHAAAEVVRLTATSPSTRKAVEETERLSAINSQVDDTPEKEIQESAAIKIQTAFRGYLVSSLNLSNL